MIILTLTSTVRPLKQSSLNLKKLFNKKLNSLYSLCFMMAKVICEWHASPARRHNKNFELHTKLYRKREKEKEKGRNRLFLPILLISHGWSFIIPLFYCSITGFPLCWTLMNRFCYFLLLITEEMWAKFHYTLVFEDWDFINTYYCGRLLLLTTQNQCIWPAYVIHCWIRTK